MAGREGVTGDDVDKHVGLLFDIDELGKFLNMDVDDLKPILSQGSRSRSDDDLFMRTCGIIMRKFQHKKTYCLLGCGNLVTLGRELCLELLATEPQPLFW